jgi:hypothetical protein
MQNTPNVLLRATTGFHRLIGGGVGAAHLLLLLLLLFSCLFPCGCFTQAGWQSDAAQLLLLLLLLLLLPSCCCCCHCPHASFLVVASHRLIAAWS